MSTAVLWRPLNAGVGQQEQKKRDKSTIHDLATQLGDTT